MKTLKKVLFTFILFIIGFTNLSIFSTVSAERNDPYRPILDTTVEDVKAPIASDDVVRDKRWDNLFNEQILILAKYAIYVFIVVWIAIAFFWWYKIMTSDKEEDMKWWIKLVVFGILWIIIMVSAQFIASSLVWDDGGIITKEFVDVGDDEPNWIALADGLYKKIMFPFIKIALYLVVWVLFIMMAAKVISYIVSTDDVAKKKALWTILRCVIWIFIVMISKQAVEAIMWKQEYVLNQAATTISWWEEWEWEWMWNKLMKFGSIPLIAQIINWAMWLTMFVLLVLIVLQWYKIFTKPDDTKLIENIKKTLLYIVIWVLVIGAAYVISNVLVIDRLAIE